MNGKEGLELRESKLFLQECTGDRRGKVRICNVPQLRTYSIRQVIYFYKNSVSKEINTLK